MSLFTEDYRQGVYIIRESPILYIHPLLQAMVALLTFKAEHICTCFASLLDALCQIISCHEHNLQAASSPIRHSCITIAVSRVHRYLR
jgi:hypothetical protein